VSVEVVIGTSNHHAEITCLSHDQPGVTPALSVLRRYDRRCFHTSAHDRVIAGGSVVEVSDGVVEFEVRSCRRPEVALRVLAAAAFTTPVTVVEQSRDSREVLASCITFHGQLRGELTAVRGHLNNVAFEAGGRKLVERALIATTVRAPEAHCTTDGVVPDRQSTGRHDHVTGNFGSRSNSASASSRAGRAIHGTTSGDSATTSASSTRSISAAGSNNAPNTYPPTTVTSDHSAARSRPSATSPSRLIAVERFITAWSRKDQRRAPAMRKCSRAGNMRV
jgi:hypothetical protein